MPCYCRRRMAIPARKQATYADLLAVPDHQVAEIIDGDLHVQPRPASRHAWAASALGAELGGPFQRSRGGPGGWIILDEPELHLGSDVLVPDLAGWRRERMPEFPDAAYFTLAPDWVAEIESPSTARIDRTRKRSIYARERIEHLWFIDPKTRVLEAFRLEGDHWVLLGAWSNGDVARVPPFEAVELELAALWPD